MKEAAAISVFLFFSLAGNAQNVGIGVPNPGAKLEVAGGVKISDSIYIGGQVRILSGAPGAGKVLTSNATGLATWQTPAASGPCGLTIGQPYQGGIIFYLDPSGCHGLISAPTDQSTGIGWWNGSFTETYASGSGLFDGDGNCDRIRRAQGDCESCYAAEICLDLILGVYDDWYLPSKYELNLMHGNIGQGNALGLGNVGGFAFDKYWSSTEGENDVGAWAQYFLDGSQGGILKHVTCRVRASRAF